MKVFVGIVIEDDAVDELSLVAKRLHALVVSDTVPEPYKESEWMRIGTLISNAFLHHFKKEKPTSPCH